MLKKINHKYITDNNYNILTPRVTLLHLFIELQYSLVAHNIHVMIHFVQLQHTSSIPRGKGQVISLDGIVDRSFHQDLVGCGEIFTPCGLQYGECAATYEASESEPHIDINV